MGNVNKEQIKQFELEIEKVSYCDDLEECCKKVEKYAEDIILAATEQIKNLVVLITPPGANPTEIVTWIKAHIKTVEGPYMKAIDTQVELLSEIASLLNKLNTKSQTLTCGFPIPNAPSIPTLPTSSTYS